MFVNVFWKIFVKEKKKNPWCRSGIPLLLSFLLNFEIFLHSFFWKYEHSIKKNCKESFWMNVEKFSWKKKKFYAVEVGFHCSCRPSRISCFFLHSLFWKYEHSIKKKCKECFWMYRNFLKERLGERPTQRASLTLFACFPRKERLLDAFGTFPKNR